MLGVFGDSFSTTNITFGGWPLELAKLMNVKYDNHSWPGTSLWYSYKKFLKSYTKYTHIVFTYTNPHRWMALPDHLNGWEWIISDYYLNLALGIPESAKKEMKKIVDVHQYFFDDELNNFVYQGIFNSVNKICKDNNIKLYNILAFESLYTPHFMTFKNSSSNMGNRIISVDDRKGACMLGMMAVSQEETKTAKTDEKINYVNKVSDIRPCHLNITNNKLVAQIIYDNFNKEFDYEIVDLLDKNYNDDPEELKQMINLVIQNENRK